MKFFRKYKKQFATLALISIVNEIVLPTVASANNGGEVNAEYSTGGGVGNDLVNMYNGAFNYKVDLLTVPGAGVSFPINISYNSADVNMLSVPTSVGLGWSLNIPQITRQVKAIPDDFNGDLITYDYDRKPVWDMQYDITPERSTEYFGFEANFLDKPGGGNKWQLMTPLQVGLNSQAGFYFTFGAKSPKKGVFSNVLTNSSGVSSGVGVDGQVTIVYDSRYGLTFSPKFTPSFGTETRERKDTYHYDAGLELSGSIRRGFDGFNIGAPLLNFSFGNSGVPMVDVPMITETKKFNVKLGFSILGGATKFGKFKSSAPKGFYKGSYTVTKIKDKHITRPAIGLLYDQGPQKNKTYIKDFIKNEFEVNEETPFLPASQVGKDIFVQSGGYGGVFTVDDPDFSLWSKTKQQSETDKRVYSFEVGFGASAYEGGFDYNKYTGKSESGPWISDNLSSYYPAIANSLITRKKLKASEITTKNDFYTEWKGDEPLAPVTMLRGAYGGSRTGFKLTDEFVLNADNIKRRRDTDEDLKLSTNVSALENADNKKLKYVQYLTTDEARKYGNTKDDEYYDLKINNLPNLAKLLRRKNHIAEINVFERDQSHLIYGEPVYNMKKMDASFSLDTRSGSSEFENDNLGFGDYRTNLTSKNKDANNNLKAGAVGSQVLNKVTTPEYATTWLVRKIPSRDYEDVGNDGLSNDDKGDCINFSYFKPADDEATRNQTYRWRFPYEGVSVSQGSPGYPTDNMGSYSYGENELKYVNQIETKTHYAQFIYDQNYSDYYPNSYALRKDGYPVKTDMGTPIGPMDNPLPIGDDFTQGGICVGSFDGMTGLGKFEKTWQLKEIRLYAKNPDGTKKTNKEDFIQKVVLEQNYELCDNFPSNINWATHTSEMDEEDQKAGKLTLNKVYSTYRYSDKGESYKYEFDYKADVTGHNPDYNELAIDRWGDHIGNIPAGFPIQEMPFTDQNANLTAAPWCLKEIKLPSGADLLIDYEKNEYAYVSNKAATQMFDVVNLKESLNDNDGDVDGYLKGARYVTVKLHNEVFDDILPTETNYQSKLNTRFYNKYLKGIHGEILFKGVVKLKDGEPGYRGHDWVTTLIQLDDDNPGDDKCHVYESGGEYYGQILMQRNYPTSFGFVINPIRHAAFEKIKQSRQDLNYGQPTTSVDWNLIKNIGRNILDVVGPSKALQTRGFATEIKLGGFSQIRLKNPLGKKKGGGYRVKTITLNDNWKNKAGTNTPATPDDNYNYILEYDYNVYDDDNNFVRSSGVATEPFNGREGSADHEIIEYKQSGAWLIEGFMKQIHGHPLDVFKGGPSVGYGRISVVTKFPTGVDENLIKKSIPPHQVYEFYTSKDFPLIRRHTGVASKKPYNFSPSSKFTSDYVSISYYDESLSQGYSVISNDMAGKLKSLITYDRNGHEINGQFYKYKSHKLSQNDGFGYASKFGFDRYDKLLDVGGLSNNVMLIDKDKKVEKGILGVSQKVWVSADRNFTEEKGGALGQLSIFGGPPSLYIPIPIPVPFIPYSNIRKTEKQAVAVKQIHKSGLLNEVITIKDESRISTHYLGFDKLTGKVLLSSVDNEFGDPIYKFSRPAYWEYDHFNRAEESVDNDLFLLESDTDGKLYKFRILSQSYDILLTESHGLRDGDQVVYQEVIDGPWYKGYLSKDNSDGSFRFIPYNSATPETEKTIFNLKVVKSGNTNLVDASIGEEVGQEVNITSVLTSTSIDVIDVANNTNLITSDSKLELASDKILNVSAVTFKGDWNESCCTGLVNPYRNGTKNYWRPYQSFVYNGDRDYVGTINNRTRNSGRFLSYTPFDWSLSYPQSNTPWILSSEATHFDKNGNLLEQKDALGLFSSSGYGYSGNLVKFVSGNSKFNESGYDGFEDYKLDTYNFYWCPAPTGFSFYYNSNVNSKLDGATYHSGRKSLKLNSGESVELEVSLEDCTD